MTTPRTGFHSSEIAAEGSAAHTHGPLVARAAAWLAKHPSFNQPGQLIYDLSDAMHGALADRDAAEGQRDAFKQQRDDLAAALRELEAHHVEQNRQKGRDESRSTTLRIIRAALAKVQP